MSPSNMVQTSLNGMLSRSLNCSSAVICVLDRDAATREAKTRVLSSAGWQVQPFANPDSFLNYARAHRPAAAVVDYGGAHAIGLRTADRLREISPRTCVIILLKVHGGQAQGMLSGDALVDLVNEKCSKKPAILPLNGSVQ